MAESAISMESEAPSATESEQMSISMASSVASEAVLG